MPQSLQDKILHFTFCWTYIVLQVMSFFMFLVSWNIRNCWCWLNERHFNIIIFCEFNFWYVCFFSFVWMSIDLFISANMKYLLPFSYHNNQISKLYILVKLLYNQIRVGYLLKSHCKSYRRFLLTFSHKNLTRLMNGN